MNPDTEAISKNWWDSQFATKLSQLTVEDQKSPEKDLSVGARSLRLHSTKTGADVLGLGVDTEEFTYMENPALLSLLGCVERLSDAETILIGGHRRAVDVSGLGVTFKCHGGRDGEVNSEKAPAREIGSIFPTSYKGKVEDQYQSGKIVSELNRCLYAVAASEKVDEVVQQSKSLIEDDELSSQVSSEKKAPKEAAPEPPKEEPKQNEDDEDDEEERKEEEDVEVNDVQNYFIFSVRF